MGAAFGDADGLGDVVAAAGVVRRRVAGARFLGCAHDDLHVDGARSVDPVLRPGK
jgi:hypothetical protein